MAKRKLSVGIIGAGIGGLTAASTMRPAGIDVQIYEQAGRFARIGAGIQQSPNAVKVLCRLGLEAHLRRVAFYPRAFRHREWDTGAIAKELPLGHQVEERFGAPRLLLHRDDLHDLLASIVPAEIINLNSRLVGLEESRDGLVHRRLRHRRSEGREGVAR